MNSLIEKLPKDYLEWIKKHGCTELDNGYTLYSGPIPGNDFLEPSSLLNNILLIGDDMSGTFVAYRVTDTVCELVEFYIRDLEMEVLGKTFLEFIAQ